ncbi:biotin carboxyl carrier protein of acetyl-CoA carboxylase-like isoform X1 [Salvia splendens]|uniref:biotin carboxyl carrier protein of acetyl-CoA carboxylase-like isoform X1 n=1 Tax=Salvia splendens TaxID=180675 RepID=UPI001C2735D1|nr:biotin carboxyl carrier protein of acetyl-CoA carboxylase-like isoform X1 [Salvia splendens]
MAAFAGGIGPSGIKIKNLDFGSARPKLRTLQPTLHGVRTHRIVEFDGLVLLQRPKKSIVGFRSSAFEGDSAKASVEDDSKATVATDAVSPLIPNAFEVESLLTVLCDTTSIAEIELKLGGFQLSVSRDLAEQSAPTQPLAPPVTVHAVVETPAQNGSASSPSLALSKPASAQGAVQSLLDKAADEGLVILQSPRVGSFRRSRTIKGKKAPPSCKENDTVKEGQVLCYIDQLGGEIPIESDISGEVVKILRKDGDPVGYGDALIAVLPSFPGIKKLQ